MLKKGAIGVGGLLLLLTLLFGRDVFNYVGTAYDGATATVRKNVPIEFELERARKMIASLGPEISQHKRDIAREEIELRRLSEELQGDEDLLSKKWGEIGRLRDDLERGDSNYVYAGHTFTSTQVETDLTNRFTWYQKKEQTVGNLRKIIQLREKGLAAAQDKLKSLMVAKSDLEVEIESLQSQLKMVEVAKAASDLNIDDSQLARTRALLKDIDARIKVDAEMVNADELVFEEIPLDEPEEAANILDAITEYEATKDDSETFVKLRIEE